jgi:hypothetical protein
MRLDLAIQELVKLAELLETQRRGLAMPRKSVAARMTPPLADRPRLRPPGGLSTRERQIFKGVVNSVKPEHFPSPRMRRW